MSDVAFLSRSLRLRLTQIEYKNLSSSELINEVERIYVEETGEPLSGKLKVFNSSDSDDLVDDKSGYNGTAISLTNSETGTNELYLISQGTTNGTDWEYNLKGIFAGKSIEQARSTSVFLNEAIQKLSPSQKPVVIGLSHSLAHNNNSIAQLINGGFDDVYSVNGAPPSFYQMYYGDFRFQSAVNKQFDIGPSDNKKIYSLPPEEIKDFAKAFYKEKGSNIHSDISYDDPLFGASNIRGFFQVGTTEFIDTNPEYGGVRELLEGVPDDVFKSFQELAVIYADVSNKGGRDKGIEELTGFNAVYLNNGKIDKKALLDIRNIGTFFKMLEDVDQKIDPLLKRVKIVTGHSKDIGDALLKANYITSSERDVLVSELNQLQTSMVNLRELLTDLQHEGPEFDVIVTPHGASGNYFGESMNDVIKIVAEIDKIMESAKIIHDEFGGLGDTIVESHGIAEMLEALSSGNRSYIRNGDSIDLVLTGNANGQPIKVNISSALKIYDQGQSIIEEKYHLLSLLEHAIEKELYESYRVEQLRTMQRISEIEMNPQGEMLMLHEKVYSPRNSAKIISINVHELIPPLQKDNFMEIFFYFQQHIQDTSDYLHRFRKSIEDFFEKDENIATMFNAVVQ